MSLEHIIETDETLKFGKIFVCDDQVLNIDVIKLQMTELRQINRCEFSSNGEKLLSAVFKTVSLAIIEA